MLIVNFDIQVNNKSIRIEKERQCMRRANKMNIDEIIQIGIKQQKDDWNDEYIDKYNLAKTTKLYLEKHLNNDFYAFIEEKENGIKENNLCELNLSTDSDRAISIYKKLGFEFDTLAMKNNTFIK